MQTRLKLLSKAGLLAFIWTGSLPLFAQTAPAASTTPATNKDEVVKLEAFQVTGLRASLASAAEIKESNLQMVDSIVASDIDKLPDINVSYALSRIPGIQVAHTFAGLGGNGGVTIRGLTQIANTIDGREVITPGGISGGGVGAGLRSFDYSQIPSSLIAGIDVFKSSSANQLEGGLGGLVDVRLRKPFDFAAGVEAGATIGTTYSSLYDKVEQNYSVFATATHNTDYGKVGVLVTISDNKTPWREDGISVGNPTPNATVANGVGTALTATSYGANASYGKFDIAGFNAVIQWQPTKNLQLYAGANHNRWKNTQDQVQLSVATPVSASVAGSGTMFSGSTTATQIATFNNVTGTAFGVIRDLKDSLQVYSLGGKYTSGDLTVNFDANHNSSDYRFYNNGIYASAAIPSLTYNLAGTIPGVNVAGASLEDPSIYRLVQFYNRRFPANTKATAGRVDADYNLKKGIVSKVFAGVRYSSTESDNGDTGLFLGSYNIPSTSNLLSQHPGLWGNSPIQNFFSGYPQPQLVQYLAGKTAMLRDPAAALVAYGAPSTVTPDNDATINPLGLFKITEKTYAAYIMPQFTGKIGDMPFDGNIGFRFAQTKEDLEGFKKLTDTTTGVSTTTPLSLKSDYTDWLPSFNSRIKLTDKLYLRLAASKTITRPNFGSMSPGLTLNQNPINPNLNSGSQGNPNLKPIRSTNYDLSLEYYTSKSNLVYAAAFQKDVKGFIASVSTPQVYDGVTYAISTSGNLNPATIKGAEVGFQQFFTFLPAPFNGFGVQANYTYVDSTTPTNVSISGVSTPVNVPLTNLSKKSYNIVAMYEKGPFSARLAYNYRDKYITGVAYFVNVGLLNQYVKAYADLDASLNYSVTKNVTIAVQGVNLTDAIRYQYWGSPQFPSNIYLDGVSLMGSVTVKF